MCRREGERGWRRSSGGEIGRNHGEVRQERVMHVRARLASVRLSRPRRCDLHQSHQILNPLQVHVVIHTRLWYASGGGGNHGPIGIDRAPVRLSLDAVVAMCICSCSRVDRWIRVGGELCAERSCQGIGEDGFGCGHGGR